MSETMKAAVIHQFGDTNQFTIEERPVPIPGDGEVLIEVHASGVNPIDFKTRTGQGVSLIWEKINFPVILGWDVSGVVVESKATEFNVGDEVFGMPRFPQLADGYAQFVSAPANEIAQKPNNISHVEAAATPLAALTAWQALFDTAGLLADQSVLIHAGAGGVGHLAIQLAKWKGARVITTTSTHNTAFASSLGADKVIDYTITSYWEAVSDVDVVFHMISPDLRDKSYQTMRKGGHLISITGPVPPNEPVAHGVNGEFISVRPNGGQITAIAELLASGAVKINIDNTYPLAQVAQAHRYLEDGHTRGKVVLKLQP